MYLMLYVLLYMRKVYNKFNLVHNVLLIRIKKFLKSCLFTVIWNIFQNAFNFDISYSYRTTQFTR